MISVDSTRPDCLKVGDWSHRHFTICLPCQAMIIGPQGTPYENGCFLFDIYLPDSYNTTSPKVQSMTTNGGLYRYNPNLYADGVSSTDPYSGKRQADRLRKFALVCLERGKGQGGFLGNRHYSKS